VERGIYIVAFGGPSRACAHKLMTTIRHHLPDVPIALCASEPVGLEDFLIQVPDTDVGGRRAKLQAYNLVPGHWEAVLYLDADTEIISPDAAHYFRLIEAGWEFVICKDPTKRDTLHSFRRPNNLQELQETAAEVFTLHVLQLNGGVWAFGRSARVELFFDRWRKEWERHGQRDQGALLRALHAGPLRMVVLGNEWNFFDRYSPDCVPAAIKHYPGRARRWEGMIPGRLDAPSAWARVEAMEKRNGRPR